MHISLGIFHRLFTLLEDECHTLDLQLSAMVEPAQGPSSFHTFVTATNQVRELEDEKETLVAQTQQAQQYLTLLLLTIPDPQRSPQVQAAATEITLKSRRLTEIV